MERTLEQTVAATVERCGMIDPGDRIVVAVSGGPDSVTLLHILWRLRKRWDADLVVAHLNHRLRGRDADADAEFVADLASKLSVPCVVESTDVRAVSRQRLQSVETAAREVRYAFFERVRTEHGAHKIATGHTADDQAETVMMRLVRGAGAAGAAGIPPVRDGRVIRPLLWVTGHEIDEYLAAHRLPSREDATNEDFSYTRNRIRHHLLTLLRGSYNPEIVTALCRFAEVLRAEDEYLDGETAQVMAQAVIASEPGRAVVDADVLGGAAQALRRRVLRRILAALTDAGDTVGFDRIERADDLVRHGRTGALLALPGGVTLERRRRTVLACAVPAQPFAVPAAMPGITRVPGHTGGLDTRIVETSDPLPAASAVCALFDAEGVTPPLTVRSRRPGDCLAPVGMTGTKTLKAVFNERDIPRLDRDRVPLLVDGAADGGRILWVIGHRVSRWAPVTPQTRRVLIATWT